jgi:hypothetical protein
VDRDIYLPEGVWEEGNTGALYSGPGWVRNHPSPLFTLPYFIR